MSWKDEFPRENRYFETENGILYNYDIFEILKYFPGESIDCVVTSPPYWAKRDYGIEKQIGLEPTFQEYLEKLWDVFDEVYRILKTTGSCWVNLGDTYNNSSNGGNLASKKSKLCGGKGRNPKLATSVFVKRKKQGYPNKTLLMISERFAIGIIERGWILRNVIIWHKPNAMPESVKDRFTVDFEYIYFFVKQKKYYFQQQLEESKWVDKGQRFVEGATIGGKVKLGEYALNRSGVYRQDKRRNKRAVWSISTKPFKEAHFAVFPPDIPETCIKAGCPEDGVVMDIFMGSGTTAVVAEKLGRKWIGIEINEEYCEIAKKRIENEVKQRRLI